MKTILVDDEPHCISRMKMLLNDYCLNEISIVDTCMDIDSAEKSILKHKPQLVFLDVQINDKTGFDLLKRFEKIDFKVVFATAYERYALEAIKFSAVDYLLKPIDPDDLIATVQKLKNETAENENGTGYDLLFENLQSLKNRKIAVPTQTEILFIPMDDIIHCKSDVNYTTIFLKSGKSIFVAKTLKSFESLLSPHHFFRIHNSHLVNLNCIKSYIKGKGGYVILDDGTSIDVSVRRKEEFLEKLANVT